MIKIEENMPDDLKMAINYMNRNNLTFNTPLDTVQDLSEEDDDFNFFEKSPAPSNYQKPSNVPNIDFESIEEEEIEDFL